MEQFDKSVLSSVEKSYSKDLQNTKSGVIL